MPASAVAALRQVEEFIAHDQFQAANDALLGVRDVATAHPEVLRLTALLHVRAGRAHHAIDPLQRLLAVLPDDVSANNDLGDALRACGDVDAAYAAWQAACSRVPDSADAWFNLGCNLDQDGYSERARAAFARALQLQPAFADARLALADVLVDLGELDRAAAEYRATLRQVPTFAAAWFGLANIKTARFDAAEIAEMERLDRHAQIGERPRAALEFALAKAYEDSARYTDAFAMYGRANARMGATRDAWNAPAFAAHVDEVLAAFAQPLAQGPDSSFGEEAVFIVSLPRSGSTLAEQILASHSQIAGAGELPDLMQVVREESQRRQAAFPQWVADATPADWRRMGQRYLQLTAHWRTQHPRFTDKQPFNWLLLAAAHAMLPGARFIDCRRDPLEACWSCFKQMFPEGPTFSYRLDDIATFYAAYDRAMSAWSARYPGSIRAQSYERLVAEPEPQIRQLLAFCGLPFEPACLDFHQTQRPVRTASAAQVREPLRQNTARTAGYGALLDPLRVALDIRR